MSKLVESSMKLQAREIRQRLYEVKRGLGNKKPAVGEVRYLPYGTKGPLALAHPSLPTCLGIYPGEGLVPFFVARHIPEERVDNFKRRREDKIETLNQQIFEWDDPFGLGSTFINNIRAQRPGVGRITPITPSENPKLFIDTFLKKNQGPEHAWLRMSLAEKSTNPEILLWLASHDSDPRIRKAAADNINVPRGVYMDTCEFCDRGKWGPGSFPRGAYGATEVGIKPNIFGFIPVRHFNLIAENWVHELQDKELTQKVFDDLIDITWKKMGELRQGREWRFVSGEDAGDIEARDAYFDKNWADGMIWGMNFGLERSIPRAQFTGSRPIPSFASFQHLHAQFGVLPVGSFYEGDTISEVCATWENITTKWGRHIDFFEKYIEAIRGFNTGGEKKNLVVWEDNLESPSGSKVLLVVPPVQKTVDELQLICVKAGNILETDAETRSSISKGLYLALKILDKMGVKTFNIVAFGSRFSDHSSSMRMFFRIMPRGGIAFSELTNRWVVDKFPEKTAEEARQHADKLIAGE